MGTIMSKWGMLFGAAAIAFVVTIAISFKLLPDPHTDTDFLVVGSVATFVCLGVLFAMLITTRMKITDVFSKKPPKTDGEGAVPPQL